MLNEALVDTIRDLHSGPDRGYHGWSHPLALLEWHDETSNQLHDRLAVYCAILLHDAVYEPRASDNETRSAKLAASLLDGLVPQATLARTITLIEATAKHAIPNNLPPDEIADMALFLDMDLSILGSAPDVFDSYEAGVRHEYREIPLEAFRQGRASILKSFLGRDRLYFSEWGRARFEAKARENLSRSIAALTD